MVTLAALLIGVVFLAEAAQQTRLAFSTPQAKLENCGAYYFGDPMAKDCPARNKAVTQAAAESQSKAKAALPGTWATALVVSLAAVSLSFYLNAHWGKKGEDGGWSGQAR